MADQFFDNEAEVSEGSEDEEVRNDIKTKKRAKFEDSEEEEEDDEDRLRNEMKDLINDEEEEPEESDEEVTGRKRAREDLEEDLEDDDYDLIEENLGRRIERKKKFRRVQRLEDDDEDEERTVNQEVNDREAIANELFDANDEEADRPAQAVRRDRSDREAIDDRFAEMSGSEHSDDSDEDTFIVNDDDRPIQPRVRSARKSHRFTDEALQQAQDIFGVDFDEETGEYDEEGDGETTQRSERTKKAGRKRRSHISLIVDRTQYEGPVNIESILPDRVFTLKWLNFLEVINFESLINLPPAVSQLDALQSLVLHSNGLRLLPDEIGSLRHLKVLYMCFNNIQSLPDSIGQLENLITLHLQNNQLKTLPATIGSLSKLKFMDVSNNQLQSLPDTIGQLSALKHLDLSGNQLQQLPGQLGDCSKIKFIDLKGNNLKDTQLVTLIDQCHTKKIMYYILAQCSRTVPKAAKPTEPETTTADDNDVETVDADGDSGGRTGRDLSSDRRAKARDARRRRRSTARSPRTLDSDDRSAVQELLHSDDSEVARDGDNNLYENSFENSNEITVICNSPNKKKNNKNMSYFNNAVLGEKTTEMLASDGLLDLNIAFKEDSLNSLLEEALMKRKGYSLPNYIDGNTALYFLKTIPRDFDIAKMTDLKIKANYKRVEQLYNKPEPDINGKFEIEDIIGECNYNNMKNYICLWTGYEECTLNPVDNVISTSYYFEWKYANCVIPWTKEQSRRTSRSPRTSESDDRPAIDTIHVLPVQNDEWFKATITPAVHELRKIVVCLVRGVDLSRDGAIKNFLALQTDLHAGICGQRQHATIATHDLAKVVGRQIHFDVRPPTEIRFQPLNRSKDMTAQELYKQLNEEAEAYRKKKKHQSYSALHKYLFLLKGEQPFPCVMDDKQTVISLPPLINSETTKITENTKDILLEVTGESVPVCRKVMDALLHGMLKQNMGAPVDTDSDGGAVEALAVTAVKSLSVEPVKVVDNEGKLYVQYPSHTDLQFDDIYVKRAT